MTMYVEGNLFQAPARTLVNTVNTVGVMGRGIALEFKRLFPEMYERHRELCERGQFEIGMLWLYKTPNKWVLNFPTKKHWRYPSRVEFVEAGLRKFVSSYAELGIHSIAFPALGCGNGRLDFESQVQPLMEKYLGPLPIEIFIYPAVESTFVEHLSPSEMKRWLRSEPMSLSFVEVWDDLVQLLEQKQEFQTVARKSSFRAKISRADQELTISASGQTYHIPYDTLLDFWQQLRTHGFTMRHIAPSIDRQISYLIPIFAELDYVTPVHVSDDYRNLSNAAVTGLQVLPSAFARELGSPVEAAQLSLF